MKRAAVDAASSSLAHMSAVALGIMDADEDERDPPAEHAVTHKANIGYVGDHLHGDVLAAKAFGWTTVAIVGECRQCIV